MPTPDPERASNLGEYFTHQLCKVFHINTTAAALTTASPFPSLRKKVSRFNPGRAPQLTTHLIDNNQAYFCTLP
jgi:hypothetical protein